MRWSVKYGVNGRCAWEGARERVQMNGWSMDGRIRTSHNTYVATTTAPPTHTHAHTHTHTHRRPRPFPLRTSGRGSPRARVACHGRRPILKGGVRPTSGPSSPPVCNPLQSPLRRIDRSSPSPSPPPSSHRHGTSEDTMHASPPFGSGAAEVDGGRNEYVPLLW